MKFEILVDMGVTCHEFMSVMISFKLQILLDMGMTYHEFEDGRKILKCKQFFWRLDLVSAATQAYIKMSHNFFDVIILNMVRYGYDQVMISKMEDEFEP